MNGLESLKCLGEDMMGRKYQNADSAKDNAEIFLIFWFFGIATG